MKIRISRITVLLAGALALTSCLAPEGEEPEAAPAAPVSAAPRPVVSPGPSPQPGAPAAAAVPVPPSKGDVPVSSAPTAELLLRGDLPYRVGPGDRLEITVYGHQDLTGIFTVLADGTVRYPLVGSIRLADLTPKEASEKLENTLGENYLVNPQVSLTVKEYLSKPVNVLGSVQKPGKYYLKAQTTVTDILTEAGGLSQASGDTVVISRRIQDRRTGNSYTKNYTLNLAELLKGQSPDLNVLLVEGDTVNVPERTLFYVSGEVAKPGSYKLESGMTLLKAISAAGGLGKFATKRGVEIHRKVAGEEQVLKFNLGSIEEREEPDPSILAEDVIIVSRRFF